MKEERIKLFRTILESSRHIQILKNIKTNNYDYKENKYTGNLQDAGAIVRIATVNSPLRFHFEITSMGEEILKLAD